ncbi:MAG: type IV pilus twitching motility protein PilT [Rickettsiales bacterium]|jgi:twitching motility protein PilT|nr:type IV pilus twitching motility protein PilT [Rickettsiales bacterium]
MDNPQEVLDKILSCAKKDGVSDIHVTPDYPIRVRLNGNLVPVGAFTLAANDIDSLLEVALSSENYARYKEDLEFDFAYNFGDYCRFRVNAFHNISGPCAVFRKIPAEIPNMKDINAPAKLLDFTKLHQGLVLVTGPTGSGKSTTLAAMIQHINQNHQKHILTIEDPVEFVYKSDKSLVNQRQIDQSTKSFPNALRAALREDPDIILVGEMRDPETIQLALTAAETGHLVFSTLHTNNAYESINRILDVFPDGSKGLATSLLSSGLSAVVSQKLVPLKEGAGRYPIHEILVSTNAVRNLIREDSIPQIYSMIQTGRQHGMQTMLESAEAAIAKGIIDPNILDVLKPTKE